MEDLALKSAAVHPAGAGHNWPRNDGVELDLSWVLDQRVNLSAAERRVQTLPGRRTVKK
ncbi:deoxyribose-phosphate aldolase, partial [Sinorhizobium meliloti]